MKYILSGHGSFYLREGWLNKFFHKVLNNDIQKEIEIGYFGKGNIINAIDQLGMGSVMVDSLKFWLEFLGIIEKNDKKIVLSEIAKIIFTKDRYLENKNSLWLLHFNIFNKKNEIAVVWEIAFDKKYSNTFSKELLEERVKLFYSENELKVSEKSISDTVNVFLKTYNYDSKNDNPEENIISPFIKLDYLLKNDIEEYRFRNIMSNDISPFMVYYFMFKEFEEFKNNDEIKISVAYEKINKIIKMAYLEFEKIISKLELNKVLTVDRAAGLDNIKFKKEYYTEREILEKILEREVI